MCQKNRFFLTVKESLASTCLDLRFGLFFQRLLLARTLHSREGVRTSSLGGVSEASMMSRMISYPPRSAESASDRAK